MIIPRPSQRNRFAVLLLLAALIAAGGWQPAQAATELLERASTPWTGDFDQMLERRQLRALVVYNKMLYFLDGPTQRGASYEGLEQFRQFIDEKYKLKSRKFQVIFVPVTRDRLLPALEEGLGDIAAANLTITEDRLKQVDFSIPIADGVTEVLVTGPASPEIHTLLDLAGQTLYVRESSSYHRSIERLNEQFQDNELEPVRIEAADEYLEDSDLLEMVNAGLLPMAIVDSHKAKFWAGVFEQLVVRDDIAVSEPGAIGWAFRKNSPVLEKVVNEFIADNRKGSLTGNIIINRYFKDNKWARDATSAEEMDKYGETVEFFRRYADQYEFDWLMLAALGYQESRLDQSTRSPAGAVGVMQLLPTTAADPNVGIPEIEVLEKNIHAGTKYLRFLRDRYLSDSGADEINSTLLTFASYNAGPAKIARLREEAAESGLDPNVWFGNVEHIVAKRIGRETVQYVSNIYKYYIAYKLLNEHRGQRDAARQGMTERLN